MGLASPSSELPTVRALAEAGATSFALELVPRISRAQSMDALSSQALVAGYRCVLEAAIRLPRFFPLYMTAAGTVPPARVLVLGAGVAGLQAIGTAKRLGARVSANDIRPASADEVASMGGTFIRLDLETAEAAGGYARQLSSDAGTRQRQLLAPHVAQADVLITTAAVPGRRAPLLVTRDMVQGMRPGSVVVDLAAESGGNVEGAVPGEDIAVPTADGAGHVTLVGLKDPASAMASDASRLYAKNVANLLALMVRDGELVLDFEDEVVAGACLTHDGEVRHRPTAELLGETARAAAGRGALMDGMSLLTITVLAVFVGFEVVSKVSSTLHTPLMSGANAIHGIILVGAIIVAGQAADPWVLAVALLAVVLATANLVGGFVVTDRMLHMFHARKETSAHGCRAVRRRAEGGRQMSILDPAWTALLYLAAAVCFILALRGLSSPRTARRGNLIGALRCPDRRRHRVPLRPARQHSLDPGRHRRGIRGGGAGGTAREDDADAPAGGAVQRCGRRCCGAGGAPGTAPRGGSLGAAGHRVHAPGGCGVLRRIRGHVRQAAGTDDHPARAVSRACPC